MPVSGVIVRSGVNAQSGGKTRLASVLHGVFLLLAVFYLSKVLAEVPLAALAGLLCVVGFRLVEVKALLHMVRTERIEAAAFVFTAAGTVSGHLMTGLVGGLVLHTVHRFIHRHENAASALSEQEKKEGVRAVLSKAHASARKPLHQIGESPEYHAWLRQIRERGSRARTAFVHNQASVIGKVVLGEHVHIAAGSSVRADEGSPFFIGDNSNIQDGVVIHALKDRKVVVGGEDWAVFVGRNVSMAHDALVHGPCYIGDDTFVGFKAVVHDSVVGSHCYIGIGAVVVGVEIPDGRFVPHGRIVDSADAVAQLPLVSDAHREFNEDVVEVNRGLATAYRRDAGTQHGPTRVVPARPARFSESDDEQPRWGHSDRF
jgi:SulP family sulfate permease